MMTKRRGLLFTLLCGVPFLKNIFSDLPFPAFTSNDLSDRKSKIHHQCSAFDAQLMKFEDKLVGPDKVIGFFRSRVIAITYCPLD
jgi:hypothetical protein